MDGLTVDLAFLAKLATAVVAIGAGVRFLLSPFWNRFSKIEAAMTALEAAQAAQSIVNDRAKQKDERLGEQLAASERINEKMHAEMNSLHTAVVDLRVEIAKQFGVAVKRRE